MKKNKESDLVEVFAGSPIDAEIVKSLLADSEIESFLKDEYIGTMAPWHVSPGGTGPVKVVISSLDYDKAKIVVEEYKNNLKK